jgi:hypothetical protein
MICVSSRAVTRAPNPSGNNPERITKNLRKQAVELNWNGIEFPAKFTIINKFEKNNDIGVNVFSANEKLKVYPLRLTKLISKTCVNLFLWDTRYSIVKDLNRLVEAQVGGKNEDNTSASTVLTCSVRYVVTTAFGTMSGQRTSTA